MAADEAEETSQESWDHYSFIVSSRYRLATIERLERGPASPSQIASDADVQLTHASRALQELRERGLVDLLVSEDRGKGRIYGCTSEGRDAAELVDEHHGGA